MFDSYEVGTRCWVHSKKLGWEGATVEAKREKSATSCEVDLRLDSKIHEVDGDGDDDTVADTQSTKTVTITKDPAPELPLRNPPVLEATSDLVTLSYLNEPSVLHAIHQRYEQLDIYTFSGIVLIATNPFDRVDNLYTDEVVQMYSGRQRGELEPHLFSIAEDAFRCMQRDDRNQTIVVSGESGAGKTMSAKYIMRYFATVENPHRVSQSSNAITQNESSDGLSKVEREILATNPIMEAFGNAKTTRNDNSSRFGKYLEIRFDDELSISGARIRTYLLERSRIIFHQPTERSYHIFYQLIRGLDKEDQLKLGLEDGLKSFHYTNQGDQDIAGVDDGADFMETRRALDIVGVTGGRQWQVFEVLAGLLHLGNVNIQQTSRSAIVSSDDKALAQCCKLLGLDPTSLAKWLTKKQLRMRTDTVVSDLPFKTALIVRDSIAKFIYSALFDWLVNAVNSKLYVGGGQGKFIGVLDIYGFEHFEHNSFEQFCINYANEKLQQEFNRHVFKLEQQEYTDEEIDWQYVDFVDNQPCIALIEDRTGILSLLDEESRLPSGTDDGFTQKLLGNLKDKPSFRVPRLGESSFIVAHYAHDVEYETAGFLEKNRDTVPDTVMEVLNASSSEFLKEVLELQANTAEATTPAQAPSSAPGSAASTNAITPLSRGSASNGPAKRATLGRMFKMSLIELMDTISSTNAHYIRCIKPNEHKKAWEFDGPMVLSQLRACGVLETIRISSNGFPGRWLYEEFAARYALLLPSAKRDSINDPREMTVRILEEIAPLLASNEDSEASNAVVSTDHNSKSKIYALGKTKVFLRAGMLAKLENLRTKRSKNAAVQIQKCVKMIAARKKYQAIQKFVVMLQKQSRGKIIRHRVQQQVMNECMSAIQALIRCRTHRANLKTAQRSVTGIQNAYRSKVARDNAENIRRSLAAIRIQSLIRTHQRMTTYRREIKALTTVQSMVRRRGAKQELKKLKEDKNSLKHYEEKQYRMENKVVELQNALASKREEHRVAVKRLEELESELASTKATLEQQNSSYNEQTVASNQKRRELESLIDTHKNDADNLKEELDSQRKRYDQIQDILDEREAAVQNLTMELAEYKSKAEKLHEQLQLIVPSGLVANSGTGYRQMKDVGSTGTNSVVGGAGGGLVSRGVGDSPRYTRDSLNHVNLYELESKQEMLGQKIYELLQQPYKIQSELTTQLIANLEVPTAGLENLSELDVLFPGNISNLLTSELWRVGNVADSEKVIGSVLKTIQDVTYNTKGEAAICALPFWMSNALEIYSFFVLAYENVKHDTEFGVQMSPDERKQYSNLMSVARDDTATVLANIYFTYVREMKHLVNKMTVSAVVDDQNIPGFVSESSARLKFSSLFVADTPKYNMDDLILLLTKIITALKYFRIETEIIQSAMEELLTLIGYSSFNDLIMRRNFLSWRRGVQITYNATRIVEWAKGHQLENLLSSMIPITQAAKLLQLRMNWDEEDSSVVYDICWGLNASQILRIISNYQAQDFEAPMSASVQKAISTQVQKKGEKEVILLKLPPINEINDMPMFMPRHLEKLEPYIPLNIDVPSLREFVELTTNLSRVTEQAAQIEDIVARVAAQNAINQDDEAGNGSDAQRQSDAQVPGELEPTAESTRIEA